MSDLVAKALVQNIKAVWRIIGGAHKLGCVFFKIF
jgi:hypothetical protein